VDRRRFLLTSLTGAIAGPLAAEAQPARKIPRVGVLVPAEPAAKDEPNIAAFRQGLRDLGYVEGQTLAVEYRYGHGETERYADLVSELVRLNADIIVVGSGPAARSAKHATQTIPVVFVGAGDPVGNKLVSGLGRPGGNLTGLSFAFEDGLVASLARPGGRVTGVTLITQDVAAKGLELVKEFSPRPVRVGFLWNAALPFSETIWSEAQTAAEHLGLTLAPLEVRRPEDVEPVFVGARERIDALFVRADPLTLTNRERIVKLAAQYKLTTMYSAGEFVLAGGLMSYAAPLTAAFRDAARYVDKILRGAKPADLPVEQPTKFELIINLKTAKALGLTIPPSLLLRADQVIE
jgi:putative ABC transport system substrate-binding protein